MAVTFQVKCGSLLGEGVVELGVEGVWGMGVGREVGFGWHCHYHNY